MHKMGISLLKRIEQRRKKRIKKRIQKIYIRFLERKKYVRRREYLEEGIV